MSLIIDPGQRGGAAAALRRHGRSFHWAGQLLGADQLSKAAGLYRLCRGIDDLADEADTPDRRVLADNRLLELDRALARCSRPAGDLQAVYDEAHQLLGSEPVALAALRDLIISVRQDLQPVRVRDHRELLTYCYGVAGTVGIMMSRLLAVREPSRALPHAIDLGIAMQMTNIARDVLEDAGMGRVYLPAEGAAGALEPATLLAADQHDRHQAWRGVCELVRLAEAYYASGWQGLHYLPARARLAIAVAAGLYREIGQQILRRGENAYWERRSVVGPGRKWLVTVTAIMRLVPASLTDRQAAHDQRLHRGLVTCLDTGGCGFSATHGGPQTGSTHGE